MKATTMTMMNRSSMPKIFNKFKYFQTMSPTQASILKGKKELSMDSNY